MMSLGSSLLGPAILVVDAAPHREVQNEHGETALRAVKGLWNDISGSKVEGTQGCPSGVGSTGRQFTAPVFSYMYLTLSYYALSYNIILSLS